MTTLLFIHSHCVRVASSCQSERRDHITHPPFSLSASLCLSLTHMHTQSAVISQCWHRDLLPPGFRRRADSIFLHKTVISLPHCHRMLPPAPCPLPHPHTPLPPLMSPLLSSRLTLRPSFLTSFFSPSFLSYCFPLWAPDISPEFAAKTVLRSEGRWRRRQSHCHHTFSVQRFKILVLSLVSALHRPAATAVWRKNAVCM